MIRDREIQRLINYAKGLGLEVVYEKKTKHSGNASWSLDGKYITLYQDKSQNKTDLVLTLIHEISHMLHWIYEKQRKPDFKLEEAIAHEMRVESKELTEPTPKRLRKKILDIEVAGSAYWDTVYKDVGLQLPLWKVALAKEFDIWQYEVYHRTGKFPVRTVRRIKSKELTAKYKPC